MALAAAIYGGWAALTFYHAALPLWLVIVLGVWLVAWHSSLQHEIVHRHPTRWRHVNFALAFPPLSLWLPYARFPMTHLVHHRDAALTDPLDDPESFYLTPAQWQQRHPVTRALLQAQTTLLGRLVIGPAWTVGRFLVGEARAIGAGDRQRAGIWAAHLAGVAVILYWLIAICHLSVVFYLAALVYPGTALLLMRSFAEHRAGPGAASSSRRRTRRSIPSAAPSLPHNRGREAKKDSPQRTPRTRRRIGGPNRQKS